MIMLTRLSGSVFALNCDLIERIDCTPDSVVTLLDGKKYVVRETLPEIIRAVRDYRSQVVALGSQLSESPVPDVEDAAPSPVPVHSERPTLVALATQKGER